MVMTPLLPERPKGDFAMTLSIGRPCPDTSAGAPSRQRRDGRRDGRALRDGALPRCALHRDCRGHGAAEPGRALLCPGRHALAERQPRPAVGGRGAASCGPRGAGQQRQHAVRVPSAERHRRLDRPDRRGLPRDIRRVPGQRRVHPLWHADHRPAADRGARGRGLRDRLGQLAGPPERGRSRQPRPLPQPQAPSDRAARHRDLRSPRRALSGLRASLPHHAGRPGLGRGPEPA